MTTNEKDYQSLKELIEGKTYDECKSILDIIRGNSEYFDFNYKSITCTITNDNGKPKMSNLIECWNGNACEVRRIIK